MKKNNRQSGQALMELLVLLLSFIICFLGLLLIMGLSIANIEVLADAKFNSERSAKSADYGKDGRDIRRWTYTFYEAINDYIPFLPLDKTRGVNDDIDSFNQEFNNAAYSNNNGKYLFNDFSRVVTSVSNNFGSLTPPLAYEAANLHEGKSNELHDENNVLLRDSRYFQRQQIYEAFERIIGARLKGIDLENNPSNTVYFPAMKVLDK